ncbi:histone H4 transcription factor-like isoform X2 [Hemicordylus capensis]|uniref:histone H4 transcription factor-like isoform X2 n=1 Tax=Hemicordylus capensis TaxID=884348 RepID=UPI0023026F3A|nr:histone H4 transcription factor-like isoform X2 [Hemicordylus capensis]
MAFRKKFKPPEMALPCEWEECLFVGKCMEELCNHIAEHLQEYMCCLLKETAQFQCHWRGCEFLTTNAKEIASHVNFHSYHTKLKFIGAQLRASDQDLPECSQKNTRDQNKIPESTEILACFWEQCDATFDNPEWFYRHIAIHAHCTEKESLRNSKKTFSCYWKDCTGTFQGRYKLWNHLRTHTGEKVLACPSCGQMFSSKSSFLDHSRRQLPEHQQLFVCQNCSKHFASKRLLQSHMRIHVFRVACSYCDLSCTSISSLKVHIRFRHSDERPFCCKTCSKSFKSTCDLHKHVETHNSLALYCCEVEGCLFTSRTLHNLRQHNKRIHKIQRR